MDVANAEINRLSRELAAAQQERNQSAAYGLELLNEKENLQQRYNEIEANYERAKSELKESREALEKAVSQQRTQVTNIFEKEVQLLNDIDALAHSFTVAKQENEKESKHTKLLLESALAEKQEYLSERDAAIKQVGIIKAEMNRLKVELEEIKAKQSGLIDDKNHFDQECFILQKQVSNLPITKGDFDSSKHGIEPLEDEIADLNRQLEDAVNSIKIAKKNMEVAHEVLKTEREQKAALQKKLDERDSSDPSTIKFNTSGSLFDEVHQTLDERDTEKPTNNLVTNLNGDDIESLKVILYNKDEELKQLRTILKSNEESAEVALKNLKAEYDIEKASLTETLTKLRQDYKRLNEEAATFASIRSQFSSRIEEYKTEIERLREQLAQIDQGCRLCACSIV